MLNIGITKTPKEWDEQEPDWDHAVHDADLEAAKQREADRKAANV